LESEGFRVTYVAVDRDGLVRMEQLREAVDDQTILISVMHANNEVGTIQPVEEISTIAREKGILFHTDAVQSVGKIPLEVDRLGADLLSLSGHKLHAPKGVGALYVRQGVALDALLQGGSQERSRRGGTENVPGAVGLGMACELAQQGLEDFNLRVRELRDRLEAGIGESVPDTIVNGSLVRRMPHVSNISFQGIEGEALLISLDLQGIAVSTGAACASGSLEPSHVLRAMKISSSRVDSAIRFSLSRMTSEEDIDYVLKVVPETVERMRELSPLYREG
jgi:cysteine desulfurase